MNRFRKHGFIEYNGRIRVHKSLLNVVLHDGLSDENSKRPNTLVPPGIPSGKPKSAKSAKSVKAVKPA